MHHGAASLLQHGTGRVGECPEVLLQRHLSWGSPPLFFAPGARTAAPGSSSELTHGSTSPAPPAQVRAPALLPSTTGPGDLLRLMVGLAHAPRPQHHTSPHLWSVLRAFFKNGSPADAHELQGQREGSTEAAMLSHPQVQPSTGDGVSLLVRALCHLSQVTLPLFLSHFFYPGKSFREGTFFSQGDAQH